MLDIQLIRDNPKLVEEKSKQKGYKVDIDYLLQRDKTRRETLDQIQKLQQERNKLAQAAKGQKPTDKDIEKGKQLKEQIAEREEVLKKAEAELLVKLKEVPNMPLEDVPIGSSEDDNVIEKTVGDKPEFSFKPKSHWEIGEEKDWIDKKRAAKVAGTRFSYIKGDLVLMHYALMQFALSVLINEKLLTKIIQDNKLKVSTKPFIPVLPPAVARTEIYEATGRLNKEEQTYKLADDDLWLNASAEHTLAPMYSDEILDEKELPVRYVGYTTAFRREAGTYGKDTEGILRLHQFDKLEMESFSLPEQSLDEHLLTIAIQEYLMQQLGLSYRVIKKCTADIGGPNARGVDIDAWMPGQNAYRETHTADYMTDYQARSMKTRVRRADSKTEFVHTIDATVFSQRPLIAIIENFQDKDGNVRVPKVLQPYMGGKEKI